MYLPFFSLSLRTAKKRDMNRKEKLSEILWPLATVVAISIIVCLSAIYRLGFKEQTGIFLWTPERIDWYLSNPAVLSVIAGDWITQFFSSGFLATFAVTVLMIALFFGLVGVENRLGRAGGYFLPVIPVFLELSFLKCLNYPVAQSIGLAVTVWTIYGLSFIRNDKVRCAAFAGSVPVLFVLAGSYAYLPALVLCISDRKKPLRGVSLALAGLLAMVLLGRMYNLTLGQTLMAPVIAGLFNPAGWFFVLQTVLILCCVTVPDRGRWPLLITLPVLFLEYTFLSDRSLESIVQAGTYAYEERWDNVRAICEEKVDKVPDLIFFRNLSYAIEGRLADELLHCRQNFKPDVLFMTTGRGDSYLSSMFNVDMLLEVGDLSQATDCALLAETVLPGYYSTRMLHKLAEISMIAGDYTVADKYLELLSRTWGHRAWAADMRECIANDSLPLDYMILRSRSSDYDVMFHQGDMRTSLRLLANAHPDNKVAIDYLLCSYLLDKNLNTFIGLYDRYYLNRFDQVMDVPELYQEALLVNVTSDESLSETVEKYGLSENVVSRFMDLMEARAQGSITRESLDTYWYYIMSTNLSKE